MTLSIVPIAGVPEIRPGDDLASLLYAAADAQGLAVEDGDVLIVCQKAVSKAEGRLVDLRTVTPSPLAEHLAAQTEGKDARVIEIVLRETKRFVKTAAGHLIVETGPGWVCANAGVDQSNTGDPNRVILLPLDPDASARRLAAAARRRYGAEAAVVVTDTWGRPWREGLMEFALGVAGMDALLDLRGGHDFGGRPLHHTVIAQADALAAAAGLVMRKEAGLPAALIKGYRFDPADGYGTQLIRPAERDLFR